MKKKITRDDISLNANWDALVFYGDSNIAILYQNIRFWIKQNELNDRNFHDGKHWTYNSVEAFTEQFTWCTVSMIRNMLSKLEKDGFLVSGNYNTLKQDRTKWYALGSRETKGK